MSVEIVAIGDLHFDKSSLYHCFENPIELQLKAIEKPLLEARKLGVGHVLFLGDVAHYEGNLSEQARVGFLRLLHRYQKYFRIYVILGNHDYAEKGHHSLLTFLEIDRLSMMPNVRFFAEPEIVDIEGIPFHFLPFPHRKPVDGKPGICVAHFEVKGASRDNGTRISGEETEDYGNPYVQGHLHTYQKVGDHTYAGTLYQTTFGESLPKGFLRLMADKKGKQYRLRHKFVKVDPVFKLVNVTINDISDLRNIVPDGNTRYKLFIHDDVQVPADFLLSHPEVVNRMGFSNAKELEELELEEFVIDDQSQELSHSTLLPKFLTKTGLNKKQVKRAIELVGSAKTR